MIEAAALRRPIVRAEARGERRGASRSQIVLPVSICSLPSYGNTKEHCGKTMNISARGIYFVTDAPFTAGTTLILSIAFPPKKTSPDPVVACARVSVVRSEAVWHECEQRVGVAVKSEYYLA
jgi:hypothetical protein